MLDPNTEINRLDADYIIKHHLKYPISSFQEKYFYTETFEEAADIVIDYCRNKVKRSFKVDYDAQQKRLVVDRPIEMVDNLRNI